MCVCVYIRIYAYVATNSVCEYKNAPKVLKIPTTGFSCKQANFLSSITNFVVGCSQYL